MVNKTQIYYNLLSLLSVFLGFVFIIFLGNKFGASKETDIYFLSLVIITYAGFIAEFVWGAAKPYYIERKIMNKESSDYLFSVLLNGLFVISLLVSSIYYLVIRNIGLLSSDLIFFLDIFLVVFIFKNIMIYQKSMLELEHYFAANYIVDIIITSVNLIVLSFLDENSSIIVLAYSTLAAVILSVIYQSFLIFHSVKVKYSATIFDRSLKDIYIGSFKIRLGTLFINFKDIIIAMVFTSMGGGVYTLYSYASKFVGVIVQVVNAPVVNVFSTKVSYLVADNAYLEIKQSTKKVIVTLSILFVISTLIIYLVLPYILDVLFNAKFDSGQLLMIQDIFIYLALINLIITSSSVYLKVLDIIKEFNFLLATSVLFFILIIGIYFIYKSIGSSYQYFMFLLVAVNFIFYLIYRKRYLSYVDK